MPRVCFLDVETTKKPVFKPWQKGAKLCAVGIRLDGKYYSWVFYHDEFNGAKTHAECVEEIQAIINSVDYICGHNLKFDLLWLKWLGIVSEGVRLYDTQVAEYLKNSQTHTKEKGYYTLNDTSIRYGGKGKIDKIKLEYWDKGVDTPQIPLAELLEYLGVDLSETEFVYQQQIIQLDRSLYPHISLANEELRALVDIEWNGMIVSEDTLVEQYRKYREDIAELDGRCRTLIGKSINLDSGVQLSCTLFGGCYKVGAREWFYAQYKAGPKLKSRRCKLNKRVAGLGFTVPYGTPEYKDHPGVFSVDKDIIGMLKCKTKEQKLLKSLLIERSAMKKQMDLIENNTGGLSTLICDGRIHTNYNQTVTNTTRLSSNNPNLQNIPRGNTAPVKKSFGSEWS